jgi:hypothetical protein
MMSYDFLASIGATFNFSAACAGMIKSGAGSASVGNGGNFLGAVFFASPFSGWDIPKGVRINNATIANNVHTRKRVNINESFL